MPDTATLDVEIPKKVTAYRITSSTDPAYGAVGAVLIDHVARGQVYTWHWYDFTNGAALVATVTGRRVARCCPECHSLHRRPRNLGHSGPCEPGKGDLVLDDRTEPPSAPPPAPATGDPCLVEDADGRLLCPSCRRWRVEAGVECPCGQTRRLTAEEETR